MFCTCSLFDQSTNDIYNQYLLHVHLKAGNYGCLLQCCQSYQPFPESGVTLTLIDYTWSDYRQSSSARNYHYDVTAQFFNYFCSFRLQ